MTPLLQINTSIFSDDGQSGARAHIDRLAKEELETA